MKSEETILEEVLKRVPLEILIKDLFRRGFSEEDLRKKGINLEELREKGVKI